MAQKNESCFAHKCKIDPDFYLLGGSSKIFKADNTIFVSLFSKHFAHFNSWAEMKLIAQTS